MNVYQYKALATISDTGDAEYGPHGGFTAVLSTPSLDRDGDRLARKDWMPLPDRLPLDADHGMSVAATIGSFEPYWDGDKLMMRAYFADTAKAQEVRTLVKGGHITGVSIAALIHKDRKSAGEPYRELLNAGVVAIPSNPDAVILSAKSALFAEAVAKAVNGEDVSALVQAIHDAAGHLGAACVQPIVPDGFDPTGADNGANDDDAVKALALRLRLKALAV